jgi:hypothetical protein
MTSRLSEATQARRPARWLRTTVPWRPVVLAWLVSRIVTAFALGVLGARHAPRPDITRLIAWDGGWFQFIAAHGYGRPPFPGVWSAWPFFPLYPGLVAGLHVVGSPYSAGQVIVANAALLVALAGVWRLAHRHVTVRAATYAVWITALFPGAITFTMGYADSLFLAGAVWAFLLLEEGRPLGSGTAALVATAARPNGFIVVLALVVAVLWPRSPDGVPSMPSAEPRPRPLVAVVAPSAVFLAVWMAVCWYHTGDPFVFITAKSAWVEYSVLEAPSYLPAALHVLMALVLLLPFLMRRRLQPPAWIALVAFSILPSFVLGVVGLGRYAVQCFPLAIAAGAVLDRLDERAGRLVVWASAAAIVGWALLVTRASYVP